VRKSVHRRTRTAGLGAIRQTTLLAGYQVASTAVGGFHRCASLLRAVDATTVTKKPLSVPAVWATDAPNDWLRTAAELTSCRGK
jgi:hypothetical protein